MIAYLVEILFFGFCGWLGHVAVKIVTLGKIDLEYGGSSESVLTEWIGFGVFLAIAMLISFFIDANRDMSSVKVTSVFLGMESREAAAGVYFPRALQVGTSQRGGDVRAETECFSLRFDIPLLPPSHAC